MRIYVVDDEPIICEGAMSAIRDAAPQAQTESFTDPFLAWEHLQKEQVDVIFLDIEMPGVNGIDLAKKIKAVQPACNIIFVTAYPQYQTDAWEMRASGYVLKPLSRRGFRSLKHWAQGFYFGVDMKYWSKDYNMSVLREGAWYFTPDKAENNGLSAQEKEVRRLAFLREGLRRAKLLDE